MSGLYEGCWHKLDRAKKHLDELDNRVEAWMNLHHAPPYTFGKQFDAKRNRFTFHVESVEEMPVEWSLIAGDVLTNLRASLDYLAHDLVGRGTEPKWKGGTKPQFAIGKYRKDFRSQVKRRMPGITVKHRTIIEGYQPYKWRSARDRHPLALLDAFVRRDKHRKIQPVVARNLGTFHAHVLTFNDFAIHRVEPGHFFGRRPRANPRFEPGAEVARVIGEKTGDHPNVEMGFVGGFAIAFENANAWFPDALEGMGQAIIKLFREIEPTL